MWTAEERAPFYIVYTHGNKDKRIIIIIIIIVVVKDVVPHGE